MKVANRSLVLLCAACAVSWLVGSSKLRADPVRVLSEPAYRELRQLSRNLDERAQHANDQARRRESWIFRRDRDLLRSIEDFARSARRFDERMANYRAAPWQVDDDLRTLLRSARDVQERIRRSRSADDQTLSDWNECVEMLNRMVKVSEGAIEFAPAEPRREEYGERRRSPGRRDFREIAGFAAELEDHAARAHELAERVAGEGPYRREYFQSIRDFHDQSAAFRRRVDSGESDRAEIRAEAGNLLDFARRTDERLRRRNAFPRVWPEWRAAMLTLQKILSLAGG
jgi:chromosome segregation ATPase